MDIVLCAGASVETRQVCCKSKGTRIVRLTLSPFLEPFALVVDVVGGVSAWPRSCSRNPPRFPYTASLNGRR